MRDVLTGPENCEQDRKPKMARSKPEYLQDEARQPEDCCNRESARTRLNRYIIDLRSKAYHLEVLLNAMPNVLPPQADTALWELICSQRQP